MADARLHGQAAALAETLPALLLEARHLSAAAPGVHGRRRPGVGEDFWQFRDHRPEDGARLVDWRRSARGDRLYVREREMEAAQAALFWIDPAPGFDWSSAPDRAPTKKRVGLLIALAFAMALIRGGERVGRLGAPARSGARAAERLAEELLTAPPGEPQAPPPRAACVLVSDGYAPIETWKARFAAATQTGGRAALLTVADPAEEDFPFSGRIAFEAPGSSERATLGRAEDAKDAYRDRLAAHRAALRAAADAQGVALVTQRSDRPAAAALIGLASAMGERGL